MLISPIISGGETIGLISADQDELNWFSEKNLKLVDTLAIHIGVAIERSLMLKATKEISERLIGVLNPEHMNVILDIVLKTAVELTKATTGVIYLLDNDKKSIIKTCVFPDNSFHPPPRKNKSGQFIGLTRRALDSKEGFIIEQKDINDQVNPELRDKIKSMAVYPLISRDNVVGILFLDDSNGHIYSQVEKLILETLANQVGIALTSYNLINELERTKQEYFDLFGESVKDRDIITSKMFYHEISHNVKNVLTQVQINMELITNNPSMRRISSTQRGRMDQLISRVQKSVDSIEEFLDLASEPEVKKVPWKVKDLVDYALRLLEGKIEDKEIQIDLTNLDCNIPAIKVNPIQMIMAFVNLIDNAIYAMEKVNRNRRLRIYTRESSPWIEVMFEDNGCGISKDDLHKLFTPFFSTKEKKGRGIGLIGTQRIIEMHHGKLPRPFSILGKETIFTVYLPKT
jgi:signal transduction histidine kinase